MRILRLPKRARPIMAVILVSGLAVSAAGLAPGTAVASSYTPNGGTANGKTAAQMARDCNSPTPFTIIGPSPSPVTFYYPQCSSTLVSGTSAQEVVNETGVANPVFQCTQGSGSSSYDLSVSQSFGFGGSGFAIYGPTSLLGLFTAELAPEVAFDYSSDTTTGQSVSVSPLYREVGWADKTVQYDTGNFNVTARYQDGTSGTFNAEAVAATPGYSGASTTLERVMSDDEVNDFCHNSPDDLTGLPALAPTSAGWFPAYGMIVNTIWNDMCLDDTNQSTSPGQQMQIWDCQPGPDGTDPQANQTWTVQLVGNNATTHAPAGFVIKNNHSHLCLDDQWSNTNAGNPVDQYTCNGTAAQVWTWSAAGAGTVSPNSGSQPVYLLYNYASGLCAVPAHINAGQNIAGDPMVMGSCTDQDGVLNSIVPDIATGLQTKSTATASTLNPGTAFAAPSVGSPAGSLVNAGTGACLDDTNWSTAQSTQMQIWACTGGKNQDWTLNTDHTITMNYSGKCLDVSGNSSSNPPIPAIQYACNSSDKGQAFTLKWMSFPGLPPGYEVVNDHGMCLDVHGDWAYNGNTVDWYPCNKSGAQDWYLT
jgi:hypothetical protein